MKNIPRYITSIPIQNLQTGLMNITLGFEQNGVIRLYFGDASELSQDKNYINQESFPNSGSLANGMYSMWLTMFSRYVGCQDSEAEKIEIDN